MFKSLAVDKKAIEWLTSLCTAGPSVARGKKKWLKVRQMHKEKEGDKEGISADDAAMWGLL